MIDSANPPLLADLGHQQLLSVIGPDAGKFLQGQLTCDIGKITRNNSGLGAHCTAKGRMISSFRIAALTENHIELRMHRGILESAAKALGKYIVFSKAELQSKPGQFQLLGIAGPEAEILLVNCFGTVPKQCNEVIQHQQNLLIKIGEQRFEVWVESTNAESVWSTLAPDCQLIGTPDWDLLEIRDGIGQVRPETVEMFIPQLINFDVVGAISFNKGCYTGQEVIARMHYLGKLKRRMYRTSTAIDKGDLPLPGAEVYTTATQQSVGNVVISAPARAGEIELLVVATTAAADSGQLYLDRERTQKLNLLPLPYAITEKE